ncbi:MAG: ribonuclease D [Rhizomicrobium sp.]
MRIIENTDDLRVLTAELANASYLALDTEFMRDQTYWPKLCLIQIAVPGTEAIIDPLAEGIDLTPFYDLLKEPHIVKVLHAARQDIEIFAQQGGVIPEPLFDTQVAAMVCGFGDAASYETLARKLAKVEIDKSARYSDWSHRPLNKRQLEYAMADVTHLRTIYESMMVQLTRTGRMSWVAEEIEALRDPSLYRLDPKQAWKRLKPRTSNKRFLAMLSALAEWREREAQARDIPRGRVLKDEALTEIAAHPPENAEGLERVRAVPKGFAASKMGKGLFDAIEAGRHAPRARGRGTAAAQLSPPRTVACHHRSAQDVAAPQSRGSRCRTTPDRGRGRHREAGGAGRRRRRGPSRLARRCVRQRRACLAQGNLAIALEGGQAVVVELEEDV